MIYKYTSIDEFTIKNLVLSQLWFSPPNSMNDQLEGLVKVSNTNFSPGKRAIKDFILTNNLYEYHLNPNQKIKSQGFLNFYMTHWFRSELSKFGISCFSKTPSESLMWAHYAKKHTGVCLIYDMEALLFSLNYISSGRCQWTTIDYSKRPTITLLENSGRISYTPDLPIISTKNSNWKYEKEIRIYLTNHDGSIFLSRALDIMHSALVGIIYGYQASEDDKDAISLILRNEPLYNDVMEYNARIDFESGKIYLEKD